MKKVKRIFTEQLLLFDFNRYSNDWYYKNNELIIVINMQKSNYEKLYFLNVGIWINKVKDNCDYPKENNCHIRMRAERLFNPMSKGLNHRELLDFNDGVTDEKIRNIGIFIHEYLGPVLNTLKSMNSLKKLYKEDSFKYAYIEKNARAILSSDNVSN